MLLNNQGVDVTATTPTRFRNEEHRAEVLFPLCEQLIPNKEHMGKMFRLETRATFKGQ